MDMEALIKKPKPVLESAHQDLTNRGSFELIGHLFIDKKLQNKKVGFGNWLVLFKLQDAIFSRSNKPNKMNN